MASIFIFFAIMLARSYRYKADDRLLAAKHLSLYKQMVMPWLVLEEVHLLMDGHLESLAEQHIDRLMIFMQPRAGKSETASVTFPSWYIGKFLRRERLGTDSPQSSASVFCAPLCKSSSAYSKRDEPVCLSMDSPL